jgi:hypothetical protein
LNWVATWERVKINSFNTLIDDGAESALVHLSIGLLGEGTAACWVTTDISALVHGALESISLPAKDVVSMLSVASWVTLGKHERLATVSGELVVELASIPDDFEEKNWHAGWVAAGAATDVEEETVTTNGSSRVCHMTGVVCGVKVSPIPA